MRLTLSSSTGDFGSLLLDPRNVSVVVGPGVPRLDLTETHKRINCNLLVVSDGNEHRRRETYDRRESW